MNEVRWRFLDARVEGEPLVIEGVEVWAQKWVDTRERVEVVDPHHHQRFVFDVYEINSVGKVVRFAAGEFSNGIWGFYVRDG